jgi:hypothetical protein
MGSTQLRELSSANISTPRHATQDFGVSSRAGAPLPPSTCALRDVVGARLAGAAEGETVAATAVAEGSDARVEGDVVMTIGSGPASAVCADARRSSSASRDGGTLRYASGSRTCSSRSTHR